MTNKSFGFFKRTLKIILKTIKIIVSAVLILAVLVLLIYLISGQLDYFEKKNSETRAFKQYKEEFEIINNFVLESFGNQPIEDEYLALGVKHDFSSIFAVDGKEVETDVDVSCALSAIQASSIYSCYRICLTKDRVDYESEYRKYVYSRNGEKPQSYFFDSRDGYVQHIYSLGDNWYLITMNYWR